MTRGRANPIRHALRFVAHVLILSGVLLLADAGATLAWQEPISAYTANKEQRSLEKALTKAPARVRRGEPLKGDAIGKISLPTLGRSYFIVEGTDTKSLKKGPGHYPDTPLPGKRGTVGIAGHRTTHGAPFRTVDKLKPGDPIVLDMPNGRFTYRVEKTKIVDPTELSVKNKVAYNRLILSACHPLYSAAQRIVVFARQTRRTAARVED
jgi:sortase A